MEGALFLVVIIVLVSPALMLVALAKLGALSREVEEVKWMMKNRVKPAAQTKPAPCVATTPSSSQVESKTATVSRRDDGGVVATQVARVATPVERVLTTVREPVEPTAAERFWAKVEDWLCVRGDFAPKGMTREFAVATRWLVRIGSLLLVGAMAYFLMLAINRGWIGPTQRVYGMMFWGVVGIVGGTWMKVKVERYSILGEVFAALGLVALYLSFGLGYRYFDPPVISSVVAAFVGLTLATVTAGVISVRLRSLPIAALGLFGGFLVPTICRFSSAYGELTTYLLILSIGASVVAYLRRWTLFGFVAIGVSFFMAMSCGGYCLGGRILPVVGYGFHLLQYALVLALTIVGLRQRSTSGNAWCWAFVALATIAWSIGATLQGTCYASTAWMTRLHFVLVALVHGALAYQSRRRGWGATPLFLVFATLAAALVLLVDFSSYKSLLLPLFCAFAAVLAELSVRTKERTLGILALLTAAACCVGWLGQAGSHYADMTVYWTKLGSRAVDLLSLPALCAFLGVRICREDGWLRELRTPLFVATGVLLFLIVTLESHWFGKLVLPSVGKGMITIVWAAIASGLLTAGIVRRWKSIRLCGLGLLGVSVAKVLFFDTAALATPARVAVFAVVGVLLIAGAFLYLKFKPLFEEEGA